MKAGIITHYDVHNHGAQLQLYALHSQLKELGYESKALRYKKNYDFLQSGMENKYSISIKSIPIYIKYLFENGVGRTLYNIRKKHLLDLFRLELDLEGEFYSKAEDLDLVVVGSDEIFSIEVGLNPCFWGFGVPCNKVISYAASFGPTTQSFISKHYAEEFIKAGVERLNRISVRDRNSYEIIKSYCNKNVDVVCDPVLLYDFTKEKMVSPNVKEKYCVVYSYDNNMNDKETVNAIKGYARKHGLKVYSIGYYHKWCDRNFQVSPIDLLGWFSKAEIVFTDTFHGSVISLVSNVQFLVKIGTNKNKLEFLLEQYGVSNRRVMSFSEIEDREKCLIDYSFVNQIIVSIREKSLEYLKKALEES